MAYFPDIKSKIIPFKQINKKAPNDSSSKGAKIIKFGSFF